MWYTGLTKRQKNIIRLLYKSDGWISSKEIAEKLNVSTRTVQTEFAALRLPDAPFHIESVKGYGNQIVVLEETPELDLIIKAGGSGGRLTEMVRSMVIYMLQSETVEPDDLEERFFISRSTVERQLLLVRETIKNIHGEGEELRLERNKNRLRIAGEEVGIRRLLDAVLSDDEGIHTDGDFETLKAALGKELVINVRAAVEKTLEEQEIALAYYGFSELIKHVAIAVFRVKQGHCLERREAKRDAGDHKFSRVSRGICDRISLTCGVELEEQERADIDREVYYHCIHSLHMELDKVNWGADFLSEYEAKIKDILEKAQEKFQVSLTEDKRIVDGLVIHVMNIVKDYGDRSIAANPLLKMVKEEYPVAFEVAIFISQELKDHFHMDLRENEISYIAVYCVAALERSGHRPHSEKLTLMFVCDTAYANSVYLLYRLEVLIGHMAEIRGPFSPLDDAEQYCLGDLIVSTVPLDMDLSVPVIVISQFMEQKDVKKIRDAITGILKNRSRYVDLGTLFRPEYFRRGVSAKDYLEVISDMCSMLEQDEIVDPGFLELTIEREKLSPTVMPNMIGIPHPLKAQARRLAVGVTIMDRPVQYAKSNIQICFLLAIPDGEQKNLRNFYEVMIELFRNIKNVNRLLSVENYSEFIEIVKELEAVRAGDKNA